MATGELLAAAVEALRSWECLWDDARLADGVTVVFGARLRRSLGRATPATGRIALHPALRDGPVEWLLEVPCHAAARIAAARCADDAGGRIRVRMVPSGRHSSTRRGTGRAWVSTGRPLWACRLPRAECAPCWCTPARCITPSAARAVPGWRCAECVAAGLDGVLQVRRRVPRLPLERTA